MSPRTIAGWPAPCTSARTTWPALWARTCPASPGRRGSGRASWPSLWCRWASRSPRSPPGGPSARQPDQAGSAIAQRPSGPPEANPAELGAIRAEYEQARGAFPGEIEEGLDGMQALHLEAFDVQPEGSGQLGGGAQGPIHLLAVPKVVVAHDHGEGERRQADEVRNDERLAGLHRRVDRDGRRGAVEGDVHRGPEDRPSRRARRGTGVPTAGQSGRRSLT